MIKRLLSAVGIHFLMNSYSASFAPSLTVSSAIILSILCSNEAAAVGAILGGHWVCRVREMK